MKRLYSNCFVFNTSGLCAVLLFFFKVFQRAILTAIFYMLKIFLQAPFFPRGGWSRFSRNAIIINAHHISSIVFADSAGVPGLRGRTLKSMASAH